MNINGASARYVTATEDSGHECTLFVCYEFFDDERAKKIWSMSFDEVYVPQDIMFEYIKNSPLYDKRIKSTSAEQRREFMSEIKGNDPKFEEYYDYIHAYGVWLNEYKQRQMRLYFSGWHFNEIPEEYCEAWKQEFFKTSCNEFPDWRDDADRTTEGQYWETYQSKQIKQQMQDELNEIIRQQEG